jgi:hypothetical protein
MILSDLPGHLPGETLIEHMIRDPEGYFDAAWQDARRVVEAERATLARRRRRTKPRWWTRWRRSAHG